MIIIIGVISIFLICIIGWIITWYKGKDEVGWACASIISGILALIIFLIFIISGVDTSSTNVALQEEYINIQQEIKNIDFFHYLTVQQKVDSWNHKLRTLQENKKSPWLNWFNLEDIKEVDFLEMPPLDTVKEVFCN